MFKTQTTGLAGQPVSRLAELLFEHRSSLEARATQILKDPAEAADVVQEAFFKFMVAAPDLDSETQALAYLRTTVTNLSISVLRKKQVRPTLTAIHDDSANDEVERATAFEVDNDQALINAEDAAIVRMALSKLSPAQRQALIMREVSGLEIEDIAKEFGVKPGNARVIVHRAREAFRRALETTIVDEKRGLTAADMLSVSVQKAAKVAKDAGKIAMALLLVISGLGLFLAGRNNTELAPLADSNQVQETPVTEQAASTQVAEVADADVSVDALPVATESTDNVESAIASLNRSGSALQQYSNVVVWPGADANGVPVGAWVSDGLNAASALVVNSETSYGIDGSIYTTSDLIAGDVLLNQSIKYRLDDLQYHVSPSVRVDGEWIDLDVLDTDVQVTKFGNIQVLVTAWLVLDPKTASELDLPSVIGVRIHTTEVGQPIFGQSVVLVSPSGDQ